jgi:hypothetical protein
MIIAKRLTIIAILAVFGICVTAEAQTTKPAGQTTKPAPSKPAEKLENVQIPKGTVLQVVLDTELTAKNTKVGKTIEAHLSSSDDSDTFPAKTSFVGKILDITPGSAGKPGSIEVEFSEALLPGGAKIVIAASPRMAAPKTPEKGKSQPAPSGGAARGALVGMAIAGNDGVGAAVGGTLGAAHSSSKRAKKAAAESAKVPEFLIKEGTKFELVLNKSAIVKKKIED